MNIQKIIVFILLILLVIPQIGCLNDGDNVEEFISTHTVNEEAGHILHYKGSRLASRIDYDPKAFNGTNSISVSSNNHENTGNLIESLVLNCTPQTNFNATVYYYPPVEILNSISSGDVMKVFKDGVNIVSVQESNQIIFTATGNGTYTIVKSSIFNIVNLVLVDLKTLSIIFNKDIDTSTIDSSGIVFDPAVNISSTSINNSRELIINLNADIDSTVDYKITFNTLKDTDKLLSEYADVPYELDLPEIVKIDEEWTIQVAGVNLDSGRTLAAIGGVNEDANSDNDANGDYDMERPPLPPFGSYFEIYFVHEGEAIFFERDTKNTNFTEETWTFYQDFNLFSGETYYIWWEFDQIPSAYEITLTDVDGAIGNAGKQYDMKEMSGYNYKITKDSDKKKFKMIVKK